MWAKTNEIYFTYYDGSWHDVLSGLSIADGQNDFVSVRVEGTEVHFRVNNTTVTKTKPTSSLTPNSGVLRMGGFNYMNGYMDEVMLWNRAITDDEELAIYNSGLGKVLSQYAFDIPTVTTNSGFSDVAISAFTGFTEQL
ncbi:MAG: hypothetical protein H6767_00455 [Candidatus Peribacteria bacterium]|nr:MAG: hypothetical protein H6767_00455 [Candidatus Peribacteria bacterium]